MSRQAGTHVAAALAAVAPRRGRTRTIAGIQRRLVGSMHEQRPQVRGRLAAARRRNADYIAPGEYHWHRLRLYRCRLLVVRLRAGHEGGDGRRLVRSPSGWSRRSVISCFILRRIAPHSSNDQARRGPRQEANAVGAARIGARASEAHGVCAQMATLRRSLTNLANHIEQSLVEPEVGKADAQLRNIFSRDRNAELCAQGGHLGIAKASKVLFARACHADRIDDGAVRGATRPPTAPRARDRNPCQTPRS